MIGYRRFGKAGTWPPSPRWSREKVQHEEQSRAGDYLVCRVNPQRSGQVMAFLLSPIP